MPTKESKADFDKLLTKYSPGVAALAKKARTALLSVLPDANRGPISVGVTPGTARRGRRWMQSFLSRPRKRM